MIEMPALEKEIYCYVKEHPKCNTSDIIDHFNDQENIGTWEVLQRLAKLQTKGMIK